ncbi:PREDICTED: uncharacterized protein LOC105113730 [Populus euphratica]|uniref:Uncharacterized protein LOC105113730 n=1 Tax=Populus euphratica TaxID=75702 RepID=A0AAJ6X799_POPEU|nr:PREDICTED: uncharacterized protein LOC105113730 [Populus euphratica]
MSDFGDLCFTTIPLDLVKPGDDSVLCDKFCIVVEASFMPPVLVDDLEDDESQHLYDADCYWVKRDFLVDRDQLLHDLETSTLTIRNILAVMDIPVRDFMIDQVLTCARQMARSILLLDRRVLYMKVRVDVPPSFDEPSGGGGDEEDDDDDVLSFEPATASSIEKLEIVKVELEGSTNQPCAMVGEEQILSTL